MHGISWRKRSSQAAGLSLLLLCAVGLAGCTQGASSVQENQALAASHPRDELVLAVGTEPEGGFDPTTGWGQYGSPLFRVLC